MSRMELEPAARVFTSIAHMPVHEVGEDDRLTFMHAGWAGEPRDYRINNPSVIRKVMAFIEQRPAVLHNDELINKKDPLQVRYLMERLLKYKMPVQVAFLQGMVPLQDDILFPRLLDFLTQCPVWSVNLGELRFSEAQCSRLAETLRVSGVPHLV